MIQQTRATEAVRHFAAVRRQAFAPGHKALFGAAAIAALFALSSPANADSLSARERAALDVRYLQTELMVAALSCGRPDFHQHYNVFVSKFSKSLKQHANVMKNYFNRQYGKQGMKQMDSYVTRLANEASLRSMQQVSFCEDSRVLFQRVTSLEPTSLDAFSASVARSREMVAAGTAAAR